MITEYPLEHRRYGKSPGSHAIGRSVEVDLISGFDLGDWRDRVSTPDDVPCFVTAEEHHLGGHQQLFAPVSAIKRSISVSLSTTVPIWW
jgi:hypothetical protein